MQTFIERYDRKRILEYMEIFPAVAILGPRQSGKSTLARMIDQSIPGFIYLDLENPADLRRIEDVQLFFDHNPDATVCHLRFFYELSKWCVTAPISSTRQRTMIPKSMN